MQQTNLLPIQQFDNMPIILEQMKVLQDVTECAVTESLLPVGDDSNMLSNECEQTTIDTYAKDESVPMSTTQNILKRSLGRPKKTEVMSQVC